MSPMDIVVKTSRSPEHAALFNYASMAYNNHFFFKSLVRPPSPPHSRRNPQLHLLTHHPYPLQTPDPAPIPDHLASKLGDSFSSPDSLRLEFLATANAMFGPGFVWLVSTGVSNQLRVLTTYLAGSPENNAHGRRQGRDQNTSSGLPARVATAEPGLGSVQLKTVICVSTWEHVWLGDYGVGGKREFLRRWWERVDWEAVGKNVGAHAGAGRVRGRIGGLGSPFAGL